MRFVGPAGYPCSITLYAKVSLVAACLQTSFLYLSNAALTRLHHADFDALHSTGIRCAHRADGFDFQAACSSKYDCCERQNLSHMLGFTD